MIIILKQKKVKHFIYDLNDFFNSFDLTYYGIRITKNSVIVKCFLLKTYLVFSY